MPTVNRSLRSAFNEVLTQYGIDNLQLEIDLVSVAKQMMDIDAIKPQGALEALKAHENKEHTVDVSEFPEQVASVIENVCVMWLITPPTRKKGGEYARWIDCSRDILDACGEFDVKDILHRVHTDYSMSTSENNGKVPYIVSGPCQLVKVCRAKAGQLRGEQVYGTNRRSTDDGSSFQF